METQTQELQLQQNAPTEVSFGNTQQFDHAQRVAKMLSSSNLIPKDYQGNIANTMIALEMANRVGCGPLMVMQNLYIVHGKPSWSGSFTIAAINSCGRFTPLRFEMSGQGMLLSCRAYANDKKTGEKIVGTLVTMEMAKAEGWIDKAGSKWKTMPEQMIQYRAGAFFGRVYAPDILMGMPTDDEVEDFTLMATNEQEAQIERLLDSSTLDEDQRRRYQFRINNGLSQHEAVSIMIELRNNQLPATEHGNFSVNDAKNAVKQVIA